MVCLFIAALKLGVSRPHQHTQEKKEPVIKNEAGFVRATFASPKGTVTVILPDDVTSGDTISGTIFADNKDFDFTTLQVDIGSAHGIAADLASPRRTWSIPQTTEPRLSLTAWTTDGISLGTTYLTVSPSKPKQPFFTIPSFARTASPIAIKGIYDGEAANTIVKAGEQVLPVVAESPRQTVALVPTVSIPGPTTFEVIENGQHAKAPTRLLKVSLSTPKTTLQKKETVELKLVVEGISDLGKDTAPMIVVENLTPKAIDLDGKVKHFLFAHPSKEGDYEHSFLVTSLMAGSFSISATVDPGSGTKIEPSKSTNGH